MAVGREPPGGSDDAADASTDETTLADEEWPVAEHYRVEPPPTTVEDDATIILRQGAPAPQGPIRRFPPEFGRGALAAMLVVLLALLLIPAGIWLASNDDAEATSATTTPETTTPPATTSAPETTTATTLPDVSGQALAEARGLLERADYRVRFRRVPSERPRDEVLGQVPEGGSEVASGSVVVLTVSGVPERIAVPDVEGTRAGEAIDALREVGLEARTRAVESGESPGTVVGQTPAAGREVTGGTVVVLEVAEPPVTPPAPATVEIPNLVGLTAADARGRLRGLGLRSTQRPIESERPKGTVVAQSPAAGRKVREGGIVVLTVSTGPAQISVPNVVGLDEAAARASLESAGFQVQVVDEPTTDPAQDGIVVGQTPAAGSPGSQGSVVTVTVARFS